jgi:predicted ATP-grasp superfamily ATP-dependent carboligase
MTNTEEKVLIVSAVPSLGWKAARALAATGRAVYFAGPCGLVGREWMPHWRHYYELRQLRWVARDRVDTSILDEIELLCDELGIDVVVPSDWPTTVLLGEHRSRGLGRRRFASSSIETLLALHDKWAFSQLLQRLDVPQPRTVIASELGDLSALKFPVLTKPRDASNGRGIETHADAASLRRFAAARPPRILEHTIVQEHVPGDDVTVSLLADHGRLVALGSAVQKRWRRWFFSNERLQAHVERIVSETKFHGPGHLDFRMDPDRRQLWAIEFNPRLNGSLVYFARAGLNVVDLALRVSNGERLEGVASPTTGLRLLDPSDIATGLYMTALMQAARRGWLPAHLVRRQVPEHVAPARARP